MASSQITSSSTRPRQTLTHAHVTPSTRSASTYSKTTSSSSRPTHTHACCRYESFDTLCIYLESENQPAGEPQDGSYWVRYRIAAISQKHPHLTEWKQSSICTHSWNNSVLQFIKVPDMLDAEKGYLVKESMILACDILECTPWLEFGDADLASEGDCDALASDGDGPLDAQVRASAVCASTSLCFYVPGSMSTVLVVLCMVSDSGPSQACVKLLFPCLVSDSGSSHQ